MRAFACEDLSTALGDEDIVLDADAKLAREVDAGLDRDDLAGLQSAFRFFFEEGDLVDFEAEAVPGAVAVDGQAAFPNCVSGGGIDFDQLGSCFGRSYRGGLCLLYGLIGPAVGGNRLAEGEGSRDIAAVSVESGSEVDQDGIPLAEPSL